MPPTSTRPEPSDFVHRAEGALIGCRIDDAIRDAQTIAIDIQNDREPGRPRFFSSVTATTERTDGIAVVAFDFNGIEIRTYPGSDMYGLLRDFRRALGGRFDGPVGPNPAHHLTSEELAAELAAAVKREAQERQSAIESAERVEKALAAIQPRLDGNPLQTINDVAWQELRAINAEGDYSNACVEFADRWGRLMQHACDGGTNIADVAKDLSREADISGITGFMYGAAVSMLATHWIHGEELRRWHNLDIQIGSEGEKANESGGKLNPALMTVGAES